MIEDVYKKTKEKMEKSIHFLIEELKGIRSGRAHSSLVENIQVEYYGSKVPLKQIATISVPETRLIVIQPWDKNALQDIEKALLASEIGVTPSNDGKIIRLALPQLSEEQRQNLAKVVHKKGEECKIAIRNIRREANHNIDKIKNEGHISKDDVEKAHKEIQKFTDDYIKKVDEIVAKKVDEIMEV